MIIEKIFEKTVNLSVERNWTAYFCTNENEFISDDFQE